MVSLQRGRLETGLLHWIGLRPVLTGGGASDSVFGALCGRDWWKLTRVTSSIDDATMNDMGRATVDVIRCWAAEGERGGDWRQAGQLNALQLLTSSEKILVTQERGWQNDDVLIALLQAHEALALGPQHFADPHDANLPKLLVGGRISGDGETSVFGTC